MIKFGPSGNSVGFGLAGFKSSEDSAKWCKNLNLDCFEYSFGRGVNLSSAKAIAIGEAFKKESVEISVHAPYFINFANVDDEMAKNSYNYVLQSCEMAKNMGASRVVFHPSTQGKLARQDAVNLTIERLKILADLVYQNHFDDLKICPETMGKSAQIGTIEEITEFCKLDKIFVPTVDFGHVNAREQGSLKTTQDYLGRLNYMLDNLGYEKMKNFHIHFSKIQYGNKGEIRHLTFEDTEYGPEFEPLANALYQLNLEPYVVCESAGTQDIDALYMKNCYYKLVEGKQ